MSIYAGSDVSDKTTHICVVDGQGCGLRRDVVANAPDVLAKWFHKQFRGLMRVVLLLVKLGIRRPDMMLDAILQHVAS